MNREKNFSFNIWDIDRRIFEMAEEPKILKQGDLQMVAGGKINNKFISSSLASLVMLTSAGTGIPNKVNAADGSAASVSSIQKLNETEQASECFTREQVIQDIDYVMDTIKKYHAGCLHGIPEEVLKQKELEIKNLSEKTNLVEEWRIISRILAKLHDAHSSTLPPKFLCRSRLPFDIEFNDNKFFCTSGEFKNAEVTEINGIKISDIYENFKLNFSYEIEEWAHVNFFRVTPFFVRVTLAKAGIDTFKPVEVTFRTDNGVKTQKFEFVPVEFKSAHNSPFVSYKIDKENSVGIFTLNECRFNKEYIDEVDKFFADVAANNVKNVIVDLRRNVGGSNRVTYYFARYLKNLENIKMRKYEERIGDKIKTFQIKYTSDELKEFQADRNLFSGKVFILTSNVTFSSGMLFARDFSDNNLATLVGEIPGNSPMSFGDILNHRYYTPNSKLGFNTTYKKLYRPDSTKDPNKLVPDVQVSAKDALNKVYEIIEKDSGKS